MGFLYAFRGRVLKYFLGIHVCASQIQNIGAPELELNVRNLGLRTKSCLLGSKTKAYNRAAHVPVFAIFDWF